MSLQLSVHSYRDREPEQRLARHFAGVSVRIGRAPDNDLVLADPENHVSKRHCMIELQGGRHVITDTSTNGVFINGAMRPLGMGCSAVLRHGDRLAIGEYELIVEIADSDSAGVPQADRPFDLAGPFGVQAFQPAATPKPDGLAAIAEPEAAAPFANFVIPEGYDWLGGSSDALPGRAAAAPATPSDHLPADRAFFQPPAVSGGLPAGWDFSAEPSPSRQQAPAGAGADRSAEAFLKGAGLPVTEALLEDSETLMLQAGQIFRAMVDGMCALLATRAMIKGEYRVDQTQIRSAKNNPLKFTRDGAEAAMLLLAANHPGYQPGNEAVAEGFRDLKTHELALMAGMQGAAAALFRQFDPEQLKQRLDRHSILASLLPGARRARYWEIYEQEYRKIAQDVSEDARGHFGRAFSQAYEEQERKI